MVRFACFVRFVLVLYVLIVLCVLPVFFACTRAPRSANLSLWETKAYKAYSLSTQTLVRGRGVTAQGTSRVALLTQRL